MAVTRGCAFAMSKARSRPAASLDIRNQFDILRRVGKRAHLLRRYDLRHQHDVRPALHHRGEVFAAAAFQRIDAHRGDISPASPLGKQFQGQLPGPGPQLRRREVLQLLDQHIGARAGGRRVGRRIGARNQQPAAARPGHGQVLAISASSFATRASSSAASR
jgi:hypothetical protein